MIWETVAGGEDEEDEVLLRVVGPNGFVLEKRGLRGQTLSLKAVDAQGSVLADGAYKYELRTLPRVEKAGLEALVQAGHTAQILEIKRLAQELMRVETGAFFIEGGAIVMPENEVAE